MKFHLVQKNSTHLFAIFLYDRLFYDRFCIPSGDELIKSIINEDDRTIFAYKIASEQPITINSDKYL